MQNSPRSSPASAPFRLEWSPSRWPLLALLSLAPLAAASAVLSGLPRPLGWLLAAAALGCGLCQARSQSRRRPQVLVLGSGGEAALDGVQVQAWRLAWRGPLAILHLVDADGGRRHLVWWPDTLPAELRRELRLAGQRGNASRLTQPMAP